MCIPLGGGGYDTGSNPAEFNPLGTSASSGGPIDFGAIGLGLQGAGVFTSAMGAYDKAKADRATAQYNAAVERNNGLLYEYRARDAITRGQTETASVRLRTAATIGAQRAAMAARGLSLDEGSPLNILLDSKYMGELDALTVSDNAAREAWALRESAKGNEDRARLYDYQADSIDPKSAAFTSLLGGAGTVAASWYRLKTASY